MSNATSRRAAEYRAMPLQQAALDASKITGSSKNDGIASPSDAREKRSHVAAAMLIAAAVAIAIGYATRKSDAIVPYEGLGYYLGIAGGSIMLLQILYSAVKRSRILRQVASPRTLFNAHMFLGLAGPITILYHCRFSWGAFNSNVALVTMALVVFSGITGRIIYRVVHSGLNDTRTDAHALLSHAQQLIGLTDADAGTSGEIAARLSEFASLQLQSATLRGQYEVARSIRLKKAEAQLKFSSLIRRVLSENASASGWSEIERQKRLAAADQHVKDFLDTTVRATQLLFWERLLSKWHYLHVPLYYLLVVSGLAHVVGVHWY
jgi:hypothetical protein